jgi:hypothetical protein
VENNLPVPWDPVRAHANTRMCVEYRQTYTVYTHVRECVCLRLQVFYKDLYTQFWMKGCIHWDKSVGNQLRLEGTCPLHLRVEE